MKNLFQEIEKWSEKYNFSFQFWGEGNNNIYISKDDVDLFDTGGYDTIEEVVIAALEWVYRVNRTPKNRRIFQPTQQMNSKDTSEFELLPAWLQELWRENPSIARKAEKHLKELSSQPSTEKEEEKCFENLFKDHAKFSNETFGYQRDHIGPLHHLRKEIDELLENPYDEYEYADCMLLLMDAYRRKGGTSKGFINTCFEKLEINKNRNWGEADENGVIQHIETPPKD